MTKKKNKISLGSILLTAGSFVTLCVAESDGLLLIGFIGFVGGIINILNNLSK